MSSNLRQKKRVLKKVVKNEKEKKIMVKDLGTPTKNIRVHLKIFSFCSFYFFYRYVVLF